MAQVKDLVVMGASRVIGKAFASTFSGPLEGVASSAIYDKNGNDITTYVRGLSINANRITAEYGDGSTESLAVDNASSADHASTADVATTDNSGNNISSYIKSISIENSTMTLLRGDGTSTTATIEAASSASSASSAGSASTAEFDTSGNNISSYVKNISIDNATMTLTRGDSSTYSFTVNAATSNYANNAGTATNDNIGNNISSYVKNVAINNVTMTFTRGDGSTFSHDINNASSATYASSATVATKDAEDNNISSYVKSVSVENATMTFTKGDNSTFSQTIGTATSAVAGVAKLYASTGSNTDGAMTQEAVSSCMSSMDLTLREMIRTISGFVIEIPTDGELPETGESGILYLIPIDDPDSENDIYEEYLWITIPGEGGDPDVSYFEQLGITEANLKNHYTKTESDNITDELVKSLSISNGTMTVTKGDNSTSSFLVDYASSAATASSAGYSDSAGSASSASTCTNAGTSTRINAASTAANAMLSGCLFDYGWEG